MLKTNASRLAAVCLGISLIAFAEGASHLKDDGIGTAKPVLPTSATSSISSTSPSSEAAAIFESMAHHYKGIRKAALTRHYDHALSILPEYASDVMELQKAVRGTKIEPMVGLGVNQLEPLRLALSSDVPEPVKKIDMCRKALASMDTLWSDVSVFLLGQPLDIPPMLRDLPPTTSTTTTKP